MAFKTISTEAWRKNFRSIVLLALLGVCSALAWVLAWHKSSPAREAGDILAEIRRRGIQSYWPEKARTQQWFLVHRDGNVVGWEMRFRQAGSSRTVGGVESRTNTPTGQVRISTRWRLSNNAEEGEYQSQCVTLSPPHGEVVEAKIVLRNRNLQVVQNVNGLRFTSARETPENYLPEGLMLPAIREVARRRGRSRFVMVHDQSPPKQAKGAQTPLFSFELRYAGTDPHTDGMMVEQSYGPDHSRMIVLDEKGNVLRRYQGNRKWTPVPRETVLQHYPAAAEYVSDDETEKT